VTKKCMYFRRLGWGGGRWGWREVCPVFRDHCT